MKKTLMVIYCLLLTFACAKKEEPANAVASEPEIHEATGLIIDERMGLIIANCTSCHSAKLITQNRASREGWKSSIRWMQATQKLHDLGENEEAILDYLAKYYAPGEVGRRAPLSDIDWYELDTVTTAF